MDAGDDWRAQLEPAARSRIVNKILQTLRTHLPISVPEGLVELQKIAVRFEEKMYAAATSQSDYLRKISLKLISMESQANTQQIPGPGSSSKGKKQKKLRCHFCKKGGHFKKDCLKRKIWFDKKGVAYDPTHNRTKTHENKNEGTILKVPGLADSTAQTGLPGTGDWQEELYQMIKSLKDQYFAELNDLYNKISIKIQHIDNHMPSQKSAEHFEKMKSFKEMLERMLHFLEVSKSSIQPGFRGKIPIYERQILSILSSQRRKPVLAPGLQTFQQSASLDSIAQTGYPGAGDLQEELYEMIKSLKDQYFVELNYLYNKISMKIQHIDNHQKSAEQYEKMKGFKLMLERTLQFLQVNKSSIQPAFRDRIPVYERQILSILSSQRRKPVQAPGQQTFQQSGGQAPSSNISQQHQTSQGLQQHDSHTDQMPQASLPSDCMNKGVLAAKEEAKEVVMPFLQKRWLFQE